MLADNKEEVVFGYGHENIQATHRTTLEFTKEEHLSRNGDCIVAVAADKALSDLTSEFKEQMRKSTARLIVTIEADGITEKVRAWGSRELILNHSTDIVIRKSGYVCNRTLAVHADKAAQDLSRELVRKMKNNEQKVRITLKVSN